MATVVVATRTPCNVLMAIGSYPELVTWADTLYQEKLFPTKSLFDKAYAAYWASKETGDRFFRRGKKVFLTPADMDQWEARADEFETDFQFVIACVRERMQNGHTVFLY
jgi:hypothetical protein